MKQRFRSVNPHRVIRLLIFLVLIFLFPVGIHRALAKNTLEKTPFQKYIHANNLLISGNVEKARQEFMSILTEHPDDPVIPKVFMGLGEVYRRQRLTDYAIRMYQTLLDNYPDYREKKIVQDRMVNLLITEGKLHEAEQLIMDLMKERPGEHHLARRLASVLERQGEKKEAIEVYEQLYQVSKDIWLRNKLFTLYDDLEQTDDKIKQLKKTISEHPGDVETRLFLAHFLKFGKNYRQAAQVLAELVRSQPGNPSLHYELGQTYLAYGDEQAISEFIKAMKLNPADTRYAVALGNAYFNAGDTAKAVEAWFIIIQKTPNKPQVYQTYASILSGHGLLDEAVNTYRQARKRFKNPVLFYTEVAELFIVEGRFEEAVDEYLDVLRHNPGNDRIKPIILATVTTTPEAGPIIAARLEKIIKPAPEKHPAVCEILALLRIRSGQAKEGAALLTVASIHKNDGGHLFIEVARDEIKHGRLKSALIILDQGTKTYVAGPELPEMQLQKALLLKNLGNFVETTALLERLLTAFPDWPGRPRVLELLGLTCLEETGEWKRAEEVFSQLVAGYTSSWKEKAAVHLAEIDLKQSRFEKAMDKLEIISKRRGPGTERATWLIGLIHLYLYQLGKAQDVFMSLQTSFPTSFLVNDSLTWLHLLSLDISEDLLRQFIHAHFLRQSIRYREAMIKTDTVLNNESLPPALEAATLLLKGSLLEKTTGLEEAITVYAELADKHSGTNAGERALYRAATLMATILNRQDDAKKLFEKLVIQYPKGLLAAMVRSIYGEEMLR